METKDETKEVSKLLGDARLAINNGQLLKAEYLARKAFIQLTLHNDKRRQGYCR